MKNLHLNRYAFFLALVIVGFGVAGLIYAQQKSADKNPSHDDCPLMKTQSHQPVDKKTDDDSGKAGHYAAVAENGEKHMGFSQTETTHHFLLTKDGGAIQVETNDPADVSNRDKIRSHLVEIARQFAAGVFTTPFAVHGQIPPGVKGMEELKKDIRYQYEETKTGARVRISTRNPEALAAVHDFLRFQIEDHRTGDPVSLEKQ